MPTQYDRIGGAYQTAKCAPGARLEEHNLNHTLTPHIQGATVLDLACGTGHYCRKLVEWGAQSVMGVDISQRMIDFASEGLSPEQRQHITFVVADCGVPAMYPSGPFDVVLGSWLLNYAADGTELAQMFRNISMNLKAGGIFVAICPLPTNDLQGYFRGLKAKPKEKYGFDAYIRGEVADGVAYHVSIYPPGLPPVEIDSYHLRQEVWEKAAAEGGMRGPLEWLPLNFPIMADLGDDYWVGCKEHMPFALLMIRL